MVTQASVQAQLKRLGLKFRFVGRPEVDQLAHILLPGEQIQQCTNGIFGGGGALLCTTDRRLLLIDKRPWFLNVEDIGYDMITEVDYTVRVLDAFLNIHTASAKSLQFRTWHQGQLHQMSRYIQERIVFLKHSMYQASHQAFEAPQGSSISQASSSLIPTQLTPSENHFFYGYRPVDPVVPEQ